MPPNPAAPFSDNHTWSKCALNAVGLNVSWFNLIWTILKIRLKAGNLFWDCLKKKTFCLIRKLLQTTCQVSCFHLKTSEKTAVAYDFNLFNKCIKGCHKRFHSFSTVNGIYLKIFAPHHMFVSLLQPICRRSTSLQCSENCANRSEKV